jgi:ribose transport system permease protein
MLIIAVALTVPLGLGEFDLSISNMTQLSGAVVVWFISNIGLWWPAAAVLSLLIAGLLGLIIGLVVVGSRVNAFIITLGAGTVLAGLEYGVHRGLTVYKGIPDSFTQLANALVFAGIIWLLMEWTVTGRRMRAIGGNYEAARLSGVKVDQLRALSFAITAAGAGLAAIILTAKSSSYYPNSASALLLPSYAACFLGTTVFRANIFQVTGTIVGVAFLATLQSGLIMVGVSSWIGQIVQGTILIGAVWSSKLAGRQSN